MKTNSWFVLSLMLLGCKSETESAQCHSFCGSPVYTKESCEALGHKAECETSSVIAPTQAPACHPDGGPVQNTGCDFAHCASTPECGN